MPGGRQCARTATSLPYAPLLTTNNVLHSLRVRALASLSIAATIAILSYLIYQGRDALLAYSWRIDWGAIALAFGIMLITFAIVAAAWVAEMSAVGSVLPPCVHLNHYIASHLIRRLPGTIWYILGRSYLYRQQGESIRLVTVVSSLELVLLTIAAALVAITLWGAGFQQASSPYFWMLIAVVSIGILLVHPKSSHWLLQRIGKVEVPQLRYSQLLLWLLLYFIAWVGSGLTFYLLAYAFTGLSRDHALFAIGAWALVGALSTLVFFLPSNFGFTELGLTLLMSAVMPTPVAVTLALATRITMTAFDLFAVGLWFGGEAIWRKVNTHNQPHHRSEP